MCFEFGIFSAFLGRWDYEFFHLCKAHGSPQMAFGRLQKSAETLAAGVPLPVGAEAAGVVGVDCKKILCIMKHSFNRHCESEPRYFLGSENYLASSARSQKRRNHQTLL